MVRVILFTGLMVAAILPTPILTIPVQDVSPQRIEVLVTAYYGPLPGQPAYATGSLGSDIRLNGRGKWTFSGRRPKVGYAAADLTRFPVGTVLRLLCQEPGLPEILIVEDKGEAIRGDRLDVFLGYGYPALRRATVWGRRLMAVEVITLPAAKRSLRRAASAI